MPSCYICDKPMDDIQLDARDMKSRPCGECEAVVNDLLLSYQTNEEDHDQVAYVESDVNEYREEVRVLQSDLDDTGC